MNALQFYARQGHHRLRKWLRSPASHTCLRGCGYLCAGFVLGAASLSDHAMPLALGLVCACSGWSAVLAAAGGALGYWVFWGAYQPLVWIAAGLAPVLLLADRRICRDTPLLIPACAGLLVAASGVIFQTLFADTTAVSVYLLRVALALGSSWLFSGVLRSRHPILEWITCGLLVLSLAQLVPIPYLGLGYVAAGALCVCGAFPAAALAGLGLDLAQITPVPMSAVLTLAYLARFLPRMPVKVLRLCPLITCIVVMSVCRRVDYYPLAGLALGGILGSFLPKARHLPHRRGETGCAQVRLELAAGVLSQTQQLLLEIPTSPIDESALVSRAAERACGSCPCRKNCKDTRKLLQLPGALLHKPLLHSEELPVICRKSGRFLAELHRSQEQLRSIQADRDRQAEYRSAVIQQYRFLSDFLQELADALPRRAASTDPLYSPQIRTYGNRPQPDNGDRAMRFAGTGASYYVLLCDGMGTGPGAVQEGRTAGSILRRLLCAGFPAASALQSLNSLCALRERAGVVTVDLLELQLASGKATLYKWGAAPSYLVSAEAAEKIGTAGPPPGLAVTDVRERSYRLSLRRGETLVLVSDGIGEEEALRCCHSSVGRSPGELATKLLSYGQMGGQDDATVITVRLLPSATAP